MKKKNILYSNYKKENMILNQSELGGCQTTNALIHQITLYQISLILLQFLVAIFLFNKTFGCSIWSKLQNIKFVFIYVYACITMYHLYMCLYKFQRLYNVGKIRLMYQFAYMHILHFLYNFLTESSCNTIVNQYKRILNQTKMSSRYKVTKFTQ